jgi:hypothetical protein
MVDIARSPDVIRKKKQRQAMYGAAALVVLILITVGVSRLKPAAPGVDRATVWVDTVKRGQMLRQVRGSGTLVDGRMCHVGRMLGLGRRSRRAYAGSRALSGHHRAGRRRVTVQGWG